MLPSLAVSGEIRPERIQEGIAFQERANRDGKAGRLQAVERSSGDDTGGNYRGPGASGCGVPEMLPTI